MIITRSPLRITLGGGGTDLPSYYKKNEGFTLSAAINKYVYISIHKTFQKRFLIRNWNNGLLPFYCKNTLNSCPPYDQVIEWKLVIFIKKLVLKGVFYVEMVPPAVIETATPPLPMVCSYEL